MRKCLIVRSKGWGGLNGYVVLAVVSGGKYDLGPALAGQKGGQFQRDGLVDFLDKRSRWSEIEHAASSIVQAVEDQGMKQGCFAAASGAADKHMPELSRSFTHRSKNLLRMLLGQRIVLDRKQVPGRAASRVEVLVQASVEIIEGNWIDCSTKKVALGGLTRSYGFVASDGVRTRKLLLARMGC